MHFVFSGMYQSVFYYIPDWIFQLFVFVGCSGAIELYRSYRLEQMHNKLWQSYYIPVSIIVPAYNEEVTVKDTVTSLLNLDYKLYEIIVIDDGSKTKHLRF